MDRSALGILLTKSVLGALSTAVFGLIFKKALDAWGILDPVAVALGQWLKIHVPADAAAWTVAAFAALALYGVVLWMVWRPRHIHQMPVLANAPAVASVATEVMRGPQLPSSLNLSTLAAIGKGDDLPLADTVTPCFLMSMLEGRTEAQSESAIAVYVGKRLKVSGNVVDISNVWGSMTCSITLTGAPSRSVYMTFEADHERLKIVHPGDRIAASGRIKKITSYGLELFDCRLERTFG